jgi:hypothetical protein
LSVLEAAIDDQFYRLCTAYERQAASQGREAHASIESGRSHFEMWLKLFEFEYVSEDQSQHTLAPRSLASGYGLETFYHDQPLL